MSHFLYTIGYKENSIKEEVDIMIRTGELESEIRKEIYNYILKHPGLNLSGLSKKMNIPKSTMNYHLNYLKKREFVVAKSENKYVRYYVAKELGVIDKKIISLLRQDIPFKIVMHLRLYPNSSQIKISKHLKRRTSTIAFHLNKLTDIDLVECIPNGNEINYRIKNEEDVFSLFVKYRESFLDNTVDYIASPLLELYYAD